MRGISAKYRIATIDDDPFQERDSLQRTPFGRVLSPPPIHCKQRSFVPIHSFLVAAALEAALESRSRRPRRVGSDGDRRRKGKRTRRTRSEQVHVSPGSCCSSTRSPKSRLQMEKQSSLSAEMNDFPYTDSMNLTHEFMPTEQNFLNHSQQGAVDANNNRPASQIQPEAPGGAVQARKKGFSQRLKNFTIKEDEFLCSAYLNVSKDPIVGVNQPTGSYWSRMSAYFNEHKTTPYARSLSSLQHRWSDIQKDTSRFCGLFAEVERRNQSGKSEDDKFKNALQMYEALAGSQYRFVHCWLMLRNEPKWNNWLASLPAATGGSPRQSEQPAKDLTLPPRMDGPVGRDKSKKQRSMSTASSSSACLEVLQKMSTNHIAYEARLEVATEKEAREMASRSDRKLAIQEKQLQLQQEMLQLQKQDREDRLMNMDLEKMTPWVRHYYIKKQKEIAGFNDEDNTNE